MHRTYGDVADDSLVGGRVRRPRPASSLPIENHLPCVDPLARVWKSALATMTRDVRVSLVDLPSLVAGEYAQNQVRKDFTVMKRTAIGNRKSGIACKDRGKNETGILVRTGKTDFPRCGGQ